jgi:hypothetical protein
LAANKVQKHQSQIVLVPLVLNVNHDSSEVRQVIPDEEKHCCSKQPERSMRASQTNPAQPTDGGLLDSRRDEQGTRFVIRKSEGSGAMALLDLDALVYLDLHSPPHPNLSFTSRSLAFIRSRAAALVSAA